MSRISNSHCVIKAKEIDPLQFVLSDCPTPERMEEYTKMLQSYNVKNIIRISQPVYPTEKLQEVGIKVWEFYFEDGQCPDEKLIARYFELLDELKKTNPVVAIHCVSGIGRAPLLVCCALIDGGMDRLDAVEFVRKSRRGAINKVQLGWITDSKKGFKFKRKGGGLFSKLLGKK
jgi:protein tyrosine phosphatase type 4A